MKVYQKKQAIYLYARSFDLLFPPRSLSVWDWLKGLSQTDINTVYSNILTETQGTIKALSKTLIIHKFNY